MLSHLCNASLVLAQNTNSVKRLHLFKKTSLRIICFQSRNFHTGPLFKVSKNHRSFDKTALENCIFISKCLKGLIVGSIAGSNFLLSHIPMTLDGQILFILKYPLTVLKPLIDIQCF